VKLSVVIPTRNKCALLARTLNALAEQDGAPEPWEIVVVNDASTDETPGFLAAESARPGTRLRVVTCEVNVGRAAARNRGVSAAGGDWVLFLDDDIIAPPRLLASHAGALEEGWGTIGRVRTDPALVDGPHFLYIDSRGAAKVRSGPVPARYFVTQNAAVPRAALIAAGGFDERFRAYGMEDMEVAFRLEEVAGVRFKPVADPVPVHVHHHTLREYLDKKRECGEASLPLLAAAHPGRLREMRLHWVIDPPGAPGPPWSVLWFRSLLESPMSRLLEPVMRSWPVRSGHRPYLQGLYTRLMDCTIMAAYRQGWNRSRKSARQIVR
jgi:glycosyltransferase involved in cell wall biosynthesis